MEALYTLKELSRIYNRVKITYNPSSYSFKDRLVEHGTKAEARLQSISEVPYATEAQLVSIIREFWKTPRRPDNTYGLETFTNELYEALNEYYLNLPSSSFLKCAGTNAILFTKSDNVGYFLFGILKYLDLSGADFKRFDLLELFITACYLCTAPYSICRDLKWVCTKMPNTHSYEQLYSMQFLKEALQNRDPKNFKVLEEASIFSNINCPVPCSESRTFPAHGWFNETGTIEDASDLYKATEHMLGMQYVYRETIAFGLEIVYLIHKYTSLEVNKKLYKLLTGSMFHMYNNVTNCIYTPELDYFVPSITLSDVPEDRFFEIRQHVFSTAVSTAIETECRLATAHAGYNPIPGLLGAIISFARGHSLREIRISQCALLYNYCKKHDLFKDSDNPFATDDVSEKSSFAASVVEASAKGEKSESEETRSGMLDLGKHSSGTPAPCSGTCHDGSSISQALDGLIGNFRDSKYEFHIKDVYSGTEEDRKYYDSVASNVKLVNAQLIKQIRDIKTYNVGGKHAGLSAGKLDRKALHKYKYDKDIFYQNTYKQKECDLAFGIVLDASGSMYGSGIENGRITMIVLHETLKALGINHSIIDHTCYGGSYRSDLRRYQCFREDKGYRVCKNYALANITAESGNCDSGALWFMEKALLRTHNRDKICLIFSDGAPTECSGADLIEQVRHMERNGIKVIGIGIGFPNISKYYSEYANGNNLKQMLDIVAGILKEYVLTKKD